MVECYEVDKIKPNYEATLVVSGRDELSSVSFPCQGLPKYISCALYSLSVGSTFYIRVESFQYSIFSCFLDLRCISFSRNLPLHYDTTKKFGRAITSRACN